jgi:hypothetical protein
MYCPDTRESLSWESFRRVRSSIKVGNTLLKPSSSQLFVWQYIKGKF